MHEFEEGDFVSFVYDMGTRTGLIVDEDLDYLEDEYYFEVSLSGSERTVYLFAEDLTLIKGVG